MQMQIENMTGLDNIHIMQAAQILTDSLPKGWPALQHALDEIRELLIPENTLFAAIENNVVVGWGGIIPEYDGKVFELHPLAVRHDKRSQGIGSMIVSALENEARKQGGLTIQLGTDDETGGGETSLANVDLYENLAEKIKNFNAGTHQSGFYLKLGYKIIGVMPDANGIGKPDIFFGKRL